MRIVERTVPFATPWFEVIAKKLEADGAPYFSLRMTDYVSIVALTKDQEIVLVRQFRPAVERVTLELPGGHVELGETPAAAAVKELLEETGFRAPKVEVLGSLVPDSGRLENRLWCCFAREVVEPDPSFVAEMGIEVLRIPGKKLLDSVRDGSFDHALHLAVLLMAMVKVDLELFGR